MFRQKIQNSPYLFDETNRIVGLKQADSSEVLFHGLVTKTPRECGCRQDDSRGRGYRGPHSWGHGGSRGKYLHDGCLLGR